MSLASVGVKHSTQGEVRADIRVEHEECLRAPSKDLVPKMVETTTCAQGGKFLQVPVTRNPRASSVKSDQIDAMYLGKCVPWLPIVLPRAHRETPESVSRDSEMPRQEGVWCVR